MPTSARLVAAVILAVLGWFVADLVKPYLEEGEPVGWFSPVSALAGLLVGWTFTGRRLDAGTGTGPGIGLSSVALLVLWVTFVFSGYEMVMRSLGRRYDGPMDAIQGLFEIGMEYIVIAAQLDVIAVLVLGGLVAGTITHWVAVRYR